MKKNTLVKIIVGILSVVVLTSGAIAANNGKNIDIFFRNIKLMIDGAEYVPTDADGNVVEPFIYNGTTYLPVRAVATAFGKDVKWDGKNATVHIGKEGRMEPDNRLDKVQYTSYRETDEDCWFEKINGTITDFNGNAYTNGMVGSIDYDDDAIEVDYPLNGQYSALTGKIVMPKTIATTTRKENCEAEKEISVSIFDENGTSLFEASGINASNIFKFDIDVEGVIKITLKIQGNDSNNDYTYFALTDLALYE